MLNRERLLLAIDIHSRSYKLFKWIGAAIEKKIIPLGRAEKHSDSPEAAIEWIESNCLLFPKELQPSSADLREFCCYFWTYLITSFDAVAQPGTRLMPGDCGCMCPMCARIRNAPHLQPKKLKKADKLRAVELMVERVQALAEEEHLTVAAQRCREIVDDATTRRAAGFSTYGYWLINRLSGHTDGPSVLALWREIAWNREGSPIRDFRLRYDDFAAAEEHLCRALQGLPAEETIANQ
jgi:hypothetical protein